MKKLTAIVLAVVMCVSLSVSALAIDAPQTWEDEEKYFYFTFDSNIDSTIYQPWTEKDYDNEVVEDYDSYAAYAKDTVFTVANKAPVGGNDYMYVCAHYYQSLGNGAYREFETYFLNANGGLSAVDEQYGFDDMPSTPSMMYIKPGQSVSFTGADILASLETINTGTQALPSDSMVRLEIVHQYYYEDGEASYYWYRNCPLMLNEAKVAQLRAAANVGGFTDVDSSKYYAQAVEWAVENNVTSGTSATTFSPNATCTRGQIVTFLWRAMGQPKAAITENPFTDVAEKDYCYEAVLWAYEKGITSGNTASTFGTGIACTRDQVVTFLWRANNKPMATKASSFADVSADAYYADAVAWAVENGITSGTSTASFSPASVCTRAQVVTFLYRDMA